jgi:hypothetical protein
MRAGTFAVFQVHVLLTAMMRDMLSFAMNTLTPILRINAIGVYPGGIQPTVQSITNSNHDLNDIKRTPRGTVFRLPGV